MISIPRPDVDQARLQAIFNKEGLNPTNAFNRWIKVGIVLAWLYLNLPELAQLLRLIHSLSSFNIILIFSAV